MFSAIWSKYNRCGQKELLFESLFEIVKLCIDFNNNTKLYEKSIIHIWILEKLSIVDEFSWYKVTHSTASNEKFLFFFPPLRSDCDIMHNDCDCDVTKREMCTWFSQDAQCSYSIQKFQFIEKFCIISSDFFNKSVQMSYDSIRVDLMTKEKETQQNMWGGIKWIRELDCRCQMWLAYMILVCELDVSNQTEFIEA